ncbi:MAG: DUF2938 domain-containing protein [Hylemonella sp.]|nr:DUF2938 domain-containing protein [Hylemonella sp.]
MTPFDAAPSLPLFRAVATGIGATAVMDLWLTLLKALGVPGLNFALLGRWVGHMPHGRWTHDAIAKAWPVRGELALGWAVHYATGITFALLLAALAGPQWLRAPSLLPALGFGLGTVVLPLFVMQPAMGAGVASSRTATPLLNCLKSLANHTVFGLGLYAAALSIASSTAA